MNVILPMQRSPQKDTRIYHRIDHLLTTKHTSANNTATGILQDEGIVAPGAQPLLDKSTVLFYRLCNKGLCGLPIEERARTTYACGLLKASQQLRISFANMPYQSVTSQSLVVLEPTSPRADVDASVSSTIPV
jgi:hypothetical protein